MADLTYIQRIALRGDIGKLISSICKYEEDDPYLCFMCLTIYGSELHEEVISILKELFDEEIVDRMYCYVQSRIIPYSIWVNKVIADFLSLLGCAELESDKDVIRSCFCNYLNRVKEVSLYACHVLLNSVLKKEELELIHKEAFYLIHNIPFPEKVQVEGDDRPDKADVDAKFFADARIFGIAVAGTDVLPIDEFVPEIYPAVPTEGEDTGVETDEDMYDYLLDKFKDVGENSYFSVQKKDITTGETVSTRSFVTIQDVINYIKTTTETHPDLAQTYQFIVMEVSNGN